MTVLFSKKCEIGIQAVLYLSTQQNKKIFEAAEIAGYLKLPKDFVSKVLQMLTKVGMVGSKKGNSGGFYLAKKPKNIRLIHIVEAIDGYDTFNNCVLGFSGCSNEKPCPVHVKWGKLREQAIVILSEQTLEDLKNETSEKINSIIENIKTNYK